MMKTVMPDIRIGDVTVSAVYEFEHQHKTPEAFFIGATRAAAEEHYRHMSPVFYNAQTAAFTMTFQSFLVRTPKHNILVDTCYGHGKFATSWDTGLWLENFHRLGLDFGDIDFVFCTHLHVDHTGWNTSLENGRWVPTFPNAKYVFNRVEYEYWQEIARTGLVPLRQRDGVWQINCLPVVEANQAILIGDHYTIDDTISIIPTPGHSPGHYCVSIRSCGVEALALGDLIHHPLQCSEPAWSTLFCWDPVLATRSRLQILNHAADNNSILMPVHFPAPTAGKVERDGDAFRYHFL
jgi:glyoxylase-like metal-dependent hydrolase (beta-lactamase superfamily II)